jgi:hypothetical protein
MLSRLSLNSTEDSSVEKAKQLEPMVVSESGIVIEESFDK